MRLKLMLGVIGVCVVAPGCYLARDITCNIAFETCLFTNEVHSRIHYRHLADEAWDEYLSSDPGHAGSRDFQKGFKAGYVDYLEEGGDGCPPPIPPMRYWKTRYQSPEGRMATQLWTAGFKAGAGAAKASGYRNLIVVPLSQCGPKHPDVPPPGAVGPLPGVPVPAPVAVPRLPAPVPVPPEELPTPRPAPGNGATPGGGPGKTQESSTPPASWKPGTPRPLSGLEAPRPAPSPETTSGPGDRTQGPARVPASPTSAPRPAAAAAPSPPREGGPGRSDVSRPPPACGGKAEAIRPVSANVLRSDSQARVTGAGPAPAPTEARQVPRDGSIATPGQLLPALVE